LRLRLRLRRVICENLRDLRGKNKNLHKAKVKVLFKVERLSLWLSVLLLATAGLVKVALWNSVLVLLTFSELNTSIFKQKLTSISGIYS
jgi:hypothetical protein